MSPMKMEAQSVTSVPETELAKWLFDHVTVREQMWEGLQLKPNSIVRFQVKPEDILPGAKAPGDIDVLVYSSESSAEAISIEVKRVKVKPKTFENDKEPPNKLGELEHGVEQANALRKLGFHKAFLMVVIVVDGRERRGLNMLCRGMTPSLASKIYGFPEKSDLDPGVGLVFVEIEQPSDQDVNDMVGFSFYTERQPEEFVQAPEFTDALGAFFGRNT